MRKFLIFVIATFITGNIFAGGLVTNTNQSAMFTRLQSRNGSTAIDAVYYNPAALTGMQNGFYLSLNNQTIGQRRSILNNYAYLKGTPKEYIGTVLAPLFPSIYAVYKMDKIAFSFGFDPVGGGGEAAYKDGLPSIEMSPSDLVPSLASQGVNDYRLEQNFEGSSTFLGYQAGVSFKINDMLSVFGGVRMVTAKNMYEGYIRNIELYNFGGGATWMRADDIMTLIAGSATTAAVNTTAIVGAGFGSLTLVQAQAGGIIDATQRAQLEGGLTSFGSPITVTISQADAVFKGAAAKYTATATLLHDQSADVTQTGTGFTPILGANITLSEKFNIGIKYEFATKIGITNKTIKDFTTGFNSDGTPITMFPDGEKLQNDMPALLAIGVEYKPMEKLMVTGSLNYYFDKQINYDGKTSAPHTNEIDKNFIEFALGAQYGLTEKLRISAGWLNTITGVNSAYQSDQRYDLNTNTIGAGFGYHITPMIDLNIGGQYTFYKEGTKDFTHLLGTVNVPVRETYNKYTWIVAAGLDFTFGKTD